ncbi:hypothetical protein AAVH_17542 [Aphelenchoides avenae]|nr:hypothetical protein AAVH_17542 [Aphelenchus avenae]
MTSSVRTLEARAGVTDATKESLEDFANLNDVEIRLKILGPARVSHSAIKLSQVQQLIRAGMERPLIFLRDRVQKPDDALKYVFFSYDGDEDRANNTKFLACTLCFKAFHGGGSATNHRCTVTPTPRIPCDYLGILGKHKPSTDADFVPSSSDLLDAFVNSDPNSPLTSATKSPTAEDKASATTMTIRGRPVVCIGEHRMIQDKPSTDGTRMHWRCQFHNRYRCKARGTSLAGSDVVLETQPHNHSPVVDVPQGSHLLMPVQTLAPGPREGVNHDEDDFGVKRSRLSQETPNNSLKNEPHSGPSSPIPSMLDAVLSATTLATSATSNGTEPHDEAHSDSPIQLLNAAMKEIEKLRKDLSAKTIEAEVERRRREALEVEVCKKNKVIADLTVKLGEAGRL